MVFTCGITNHFKLHCCSVLMSIVHRSHLQYVMPSNTLVIVTAFVALFQMNLSGCGTLCSALAESRPGSV